MKKSKKNSKSSSKINKEKIKEEIKKLKIKIPEKLEEKKTNSELEEEIEETEEKIEDTQFNEFFLPSERISERGFSSILNKVETPPEKLEQNIALTPIKKEENTPNVQSYSPNEDYATGEARKYQAGEVSVSLGRIETRQNLPRQELPKQELINPFRQMRNENDAWRGWKEQIEVSAVEEKIMLPFERENKKYKEFKPHR